MHLWIKHIRQFNSQSHVNGDFKIIIKSFAGTGTRTNSLPTTKNVTQKLTKHHQSKCLALIYRPHIRNRCHPQPAWPQLEPNPSSSEPETIAIEVQMRKRDQFLRQCVFLFHGGWALKEKFHLLRNYSRLFRLGWRFWRTEGPRPTGAGKS